MKTARSRSKALLLFVVVAASAAVGARGVAAPDPLTLGRQYAAWFHAGETDRIWQHFSPEMKKIAGSAEGLKTFRDTMIQQVGNETNVLEEHVQTTGSGAMLYERIASFSAAPSPWLMKCAVGSDGAVTGFFFGPAALASKPAPVRLLVGASGRKQVTNETLD